MKKTLVCIAIGSIVSTSSYADLPAKANLQFIPGVIACAQGAGTPPDNCTYGAIVNDAGSYFGMDTNGGGISRKERTAIAVGTVGLNVNTTQGTEGDFDAPWIFFTNVGNHTTISNTNTLSDDGAGNVTLDFSGWNVSWNGIPLIDMGGGIQECGTAIDGVCILSDGTDVAGQVDNGTGIAIMTCTENGDGVADCSDGDNFIINYDAVVPLDDASGFGNVSYTFHMEGTISDPNLAPVATNDPLLVSIAPNATTMIDLPSNVSDPDGDGIDNTSIQFTYTGTRIPVPTLTDNGSGVISYTDNDGSDTLAADTFTYTVADSLGKVSSVFSVEVTVISGNIPPVASTINVTTNKDTDILIDVVSNTIDSDGTVDPTTVVVSNILGGSASVDPLTGEVTFTPTPGTTGAAGFQYLVNDNNGGTSNLATVNVTVNDPPVASAPVPFGLDRNSSINIDPVIIATDSDGTLDLTTVTASTPTTAGGSTVVDALTGNVTYTPPSAIFIGADSFDFTIADNNGAVSNTVAVNIIVNNIAPNASSDSVSQNTSTDATIDINVLDGDTDVDGTIDITTVVASNGTGGGTTLVDPVTGVVTFTPNGTNYTDTFTYTVKDNDGLLSNVATVTVSISSGTGVLDPGAYLILDAGNLASSTVTPADGNGSYFNMEVSPGQLTHVALIGFNHVHLGETQLGSAPVPNIDNPWQFFGNLGVHQTTLPITILTDDSAGNVTLNLEGWDVSWNSIVSIPLKDRAHSGGQDGVAVVTCAVDCDFGDTFILNYTATVPDGDPSGFGNVKYILHLEGTILEFPPFVGGGERDTAIVPADVDTSSVVDSNGATATLTAGSTAASQGNTSGLYLTADEVGLKDPLLNDADGRQCIGGCLDFEVTGVTPGSYIDLVVHLNEGILEGAKFRKLINNTWQDFDLSTGDLIGTALADSVTGMCQGAAGFFEVGLRVDAECLFLRIRDGGPNDADGIENGTIVDPSGALVAGSPNVPSGSTSGCSISKTPVTLMERADWLIVAIFIGLLATARVGRKQKIN